MSDDYGFPWLSDMDYAKAIGQFRLGVLSYLSVFDCYGMGTYIKPVSEAIVELAQDFGMRIRGDDRPIDSRIPRLPRPTE